MAGKMNQTRQILVFSDNSIIREHVSLTLTGKIDNQTIQITECATANMAIQYLNETKYDAIIMYGQTTKEGAMSLAKRIEYELGNLPPTIMLIERIQDAWLSKWAGATKIVTLPVKPNILRKIVAQLFKGE